MYYTGEALAGSRGVIISSTEGEGDILFLVRILLASALAPTSA